MKNISTLVLNQKHVVDTDTEERYKIDTCDTVPIIYRHRYLFVTYICVLFGYASIKYTVYD